LVVWLDGWLVVYPAILVILLVSGNIGGGGGGGGGGDDREDSQIEIAANSFFY